MASRCAIRSGSNSTYVKNARSDPVPTATADTELYDRGIRTLVASWQAFAAGAADAEVHHLDGVTAAIFPSGPEREVINNALLAEGLSRAGRAAALEVMESRYRTAGIDRFAAWVREDDSPMRADLERRGYTVDTTTLAMGLSLDRIALPRPQVDQTPPAWSDYRRVFLPDGLLAGWDPASFHLTLGRLDGEVVAAAISLDVDADCGIYNVETVERARRRGLATSLTLRQLYEARDRGCTTASLQSTPMADRVYAAAGFRALGRIVEYVPRPAR
jgi:GNAT superfamily N-acetyltransferase